MRLRLILGVGAAMVLLAIVALWRGAVDQREAARRGEAAARASAATAQAQASLVGSAAKAVSHAQTRELSITLKAQEAAHEIQAASEGDALVPAAVVDRWARAIDELRAEAAPGHGAAQPAHPAEREGAVPAPG